MRVVKYKTKLTADKKVTLEKELSVSRPDLEKTITSPDHVANFAREFLRLHEESEEYLYMICMNTKNVIHGVFELFSRECQQFYLWCKGNLSESVTCKCGKYHITT